MTWHVAKYGDPYSESVLCIYPIQSAHTQQWTHTRSSGQPFMLWHPGNSWGFGVLLKGTSVVVLKVERALYNHSPTYNSCQTGDSQPLGYESDSLTIKATTSPTKKVKKYLHSRTSRRIQDWRWSWELASAVYSVCWAKPWNRRRVITLIACYKSPA